MRNPRIQSVAFSSDGSLIASGGMDAVVRVWDASSRRLIGARIAHKRDELGKPLRIRVECGVQPRWPSARDRLRIRFAAGQEQPRAAVECEHIVSEWRLV